MQTSSYVTLNVDQNEPHQSVCTILFL